MSDRTIDIRLAARERGEKTFSTGMACKRGHFSKRYTSNGGCIECMTGMFAKPLSDMQAQAVQRYTFTALLPTPNVQVVDARALSLYLASCMLQWERVNNVHAGVNNWQVKIEWAQAQGKPLAECPF